MLTLVISGCTSDDPRINEVVLQVERSNLREHISYLSDLGSRYQRMTNDTGVSYWRTPDKSIQTKKLEYIMTCLKSYGYKVGRAKFKAPPDMGGSCITSSR